MECVGKFCGMSSTCDALQQNLRPGYWGLIGRNIALLPAEFKEQTENDPKFVTEPLITGDESCDYG
jgi:hypothetical protein